MLKQNKYHRSIIICSLFIAAIILPESCSAMPSLQNIIRTISIAKQKCAYFLCDPARIFASQHQTQEAAEILTKYATKIAQAEENSKINVLTAAETIDIMKNMYNLIPCTTKSVLDRFHAIQNNIKIYPHVSLFEPAQSQQKFQTVIYVVNAAYHKLFHTIMVSDETKQAIPPIQDFIFNHELRHHLQFTTKTARDQVKEYEKTHYMLTRTAQEYDADTFALQQIAKTQCPHCLYEITNIHKKALFLKHNVFGYITNKSIKPYIKTALQNPCICQYHASIPKYKLLLNKLKASIAPFIPIKSLFALCIFYLYQMLAPQPKEIITYNQVCGRK